MQKLESASIGTAIIELRGQRVILAADLAAFYGIETKRLNEAVKRNRRKFEQYAFQLRKKNGML